jgi:hypothetical protein
MLRHLENGKVRNQAQNRGKKEKEGPKKTRFTLLIRPGLFNLELEKAKKEEKKERTLSRNFGPESRARYILSMHGG